MNYSVLQAIAAFLFGHKYYANIVNTRGAERYEIASYIFPSKYEADQHRLRISHGTGTVTLRTVIRQYLDTAGGVTHYRD